MQTAKNLINKSARFIAATAQAPRQSVPFIQMKDDDSAEVFVYDVIGGFMGEPTVDLVRSISEIEASTITVRVNSPGGGVFDGIAIYNALKKHDAKVIVQIDGIAASIASVIALAGDEVNMLLGTQFMIHKPLMFGGGNADDFEKLIDVLNGAEDSIVSIYKTKTGLSDSEIRSALKAETWYSPEEALEAGFVDSIVEAEKAENTFDLSAIFENVPEGLRREPTVREVEQALRATGMSRRRAGTAAVAAMNTQVEGRDVRDDDPGEPDLLASIERLKEIYKPNKGGI